MSKSLTNKLPKGSSAIRRAKYPSLTPISTTLTRKILDGLMWLDSKEIGKYEYFEDEGSAPEIITAKATLYGVASEEHIIEVIVHVDLDNRLFLFHGISEAVFFVNELSEENRYVETFCPENREIYTDLL